MANLLKPSVDEVVFAQSPIALPARRRSERTHNVSFLAQDEAGEPVAEKVAGIFRVAATAAVLVVAFAITGRI